MYELSYDALLIAGLYLIIFASVFLPLLLINAGLYVTLLFVHRRPTYNKRYLLQRRILWGFVISMAGLASGPFLCKIINMDLIGFYTFYLFMFIFFVIFVVLIELLNFNKEERKRLARHNEFLASVTHELKTPMQVVCRYGDQVKQECGVVSQARATAEKLNAEIRRMDNRLIEICRYNSLDTVKFRKQCFPLDGLVIDLADEFTPLMEDKEITLDSDGVVQGIHVNADDTRIRWAVHSFLSNAVKFTPAGGKIKLTLTRRKKRALLTVCNSGPHIPEDKRKDIWEAFIKADTDKDNAKRGTGLGLPIVRGVMRLHKGRCDFENTRDGVLFWFEIPVGKEKSRSDGEKQYKRVT